MAIGQFLNLREEKVDNEFDKIIKGISKAYSIGDIIYKTDEEDIVILRVNHAEAFQTFQTFLLFKKQYKKGDSKLIAKMNQHKQMMQACSFQRLK